MGVVGWLFDGRDKGYGGNLVSVGDGLQGELEVLRQGFVAMAGRKNARVRTMYVNEKLKAEIVTEILAHD
ncbi:hypothetical protein CAL19_16160 [Bordetella genomosp. 7]|uniref:Uncharacterized protein n=1 Tax=Bordetella genomosp. 7 TaxID=1416805 RepID=A0A261QV45_9BORD|nr:hypothetical protein CAL19_16160 [Bordetella genomosp. 7]